MKSWRFRAENGGLGEDDMDEELKNVIEVVTLVAGVLFFVGFFVAMYAEIKVRRWKLGFF